MLGVSVGKIYVNACESGYFNELITIFPLKHHMKIIRILLFNYKTEKINIPINWEVCSMLYFS